MGANQSIGDDDGTARANHPPTKICYYELLNLDRQASEEEIKKAYRKKALELHPDRNYGNVEQATAQFAEVQSAYEILSDPHERAWYDSHRTEILRGDDDELIGSHDEHDVRITTANEVMRMLPRINACRDFSDSPRSFYVMVSALFDTLAREEELACEWERIEPTLYPSFGSANDQYDPTVRSFYTIWSSFATRKAFSWVDIYRYSEAPDRRVRRLMEKENQRLRDEAVREFNDAVRSLIAFVKKRDPRFKPSRQSEVERQRVLRDAARAQAARSRAANRAKTEDSALPRWARSDDPAPSDESDTLEAQTKEIYECIVCRKSFKNEKQFEAHERSKKHVKAIGQIRREMHYEDRNLDLPRQSNGGASQGSISPEPTLESSTEDPTNNSLEEGVDHLSLNEKAPLAERNEIDESDGNTAVALEAKGHLAAGAASASTSDDEYSERKKVEQRIRGQPQDVRKDGEHQKHVTKSEESPDLDQIATQASQPKIGKAKEKRARKAAQKSRLSPTADTQYKCATCQARFPSKSKMFSHITKLDHGQPTIKGAIASTRSPK